MKRYLSLAIAVSFLTCMLSGCANTGVQDTANPTVSTKATEVLASAQTFPYTANGKTWHKLMINGNIVETKNLPFSIEGEKGAYLPLEDVLNYFGVKCIIHTATKTAAGKVNGIAFQVQARYSTMKIGKKTINSTVTPLYVNGCLYVPNFLFMELLGATVDFSTDLSAATIVSDIKINQATSGTENIKITDNTFGDASVKLTLKTTDKSACYKVFLSSDVSTGAEVITSFAKPNSTTLLKFSAGSYVIKIAYGDTWISESEAFGQSGEYMTTDAYTFSANKSYTLKASTTTGDFSRDSMAGFTGK